MRIHLTACIAVLISACATTPAQSPAEGISAQSARPAAPIRLGEQTRVCVTVSVDEALWVESHLPDREQANRDFSSQLAGEMDRIFAPSGGERYLRDEGLGAGPRFVTNYNGGNPYCAVNRDLIHVSARYRPRPDGTAFLLEYTIRQGDAAVTQTADRDVGRDVERRIIVALYGASVIMRAVGDDIVERAREIYSVMSRR